MKSVIYNNSITPEEQKLKNQLKKESASELQLLRQGSVTEITLGSTTFQVTDPARIEVLGKIVVRHDQQLFEVRHSLSTSIQNIKVLQQEISKLKTEIQTLKEQNNNGFGSQQHSDY